MKSGLIGALCALLAVTQAAQAQQARQCASRDRVLEVLSDTYGETRQSMGLGANNFVVEVFASAETGSWSIIVTQPTGVTCLVASGQAWQVLAEAPEPKGEDT